MYVSHMNMWRRTCGRLFALLTIYILSLSSVLAASANLSTDTVNIDIGQNGSFTVSGNDGGDQLQLRWTLPSGLDVTKGSSSNLNKFDVKWDKGYVKVESDGKGSFSATINVSSDSSGTYLMENIRDEFGISPADVTVNVGGSGGGSGGGSTPPPDTGGGTGSGTADYTLFIEPGFLTINGDGGAVINVWGYTDASGAPPMVPGPLLEVTQGQSITVEVVNNHNQNHNFVIQGVTGDTGSIAPGSSKTYTFTPDSGGVFFYRDTLSSNVNREMGLHGALIVRSNSSNRVWDNGPSYDIERLWVITDMDVPRWNDRASAGQSVSTGSYRPNYFMINGQGGFDGMHDPNTVLEGNSGDVGVVRIVNAGQFDESLHWHGNHFQVISRNGNHLNNFEWQDTINVKGGETMMVLYQLRGGIFPMHVHTSQMETANGVYLNGTATLIVGN
jgi:hypothetical protein